MVAGLERDISSRASRPIPRLLQGDNLRMVPVVVLMKAFAGYAAALREDAADGGVGRGEADGLSRQLERSLHPLPILLSGRHLGHGDHLQLL